MTRQGPRQGPRRGPLRVTFVVPDLAAGGAERHVATLVGQLDPTRVAARVVCLGEEGVLFGDAAASVPATAYGHGKRQAVRSILRLARELRRTRTDVVVMRGFSAELVGRVAALLARVPTRVLWIHNSSGLGDRGRVRTLTDRLLERSTTAYFGVAEHQRGYLGDELGFPADKVRIIHNGVDPAPYAAGPGQPAAGRARVRAEWGATDDEVLVGILAALRPEKDHETLLRAAAQVVEDEPRARFVLVGDGSGRQDLERLATSLRLGDRVVFAGYRGDVADVLQALDVVALSSWSECLPMSVLEAMAASRPVVSTAVGGIPEAVSEGRTGLLVPPRDPAALAEALRSLVADPARRAAMGQAARERLEEHFTLERSVRETERRLAEVAGRPAPALTRPVSLTMVMDETGVGGVEVVTLNMFRTFDRTVVEPHLVCLREEGALGEDYRGSGTDVVALHRSGKLDLRTLPRLVRELRRTETDAVLVAHHHRASLVLGRVAARLAGVPVSLVATHGMDLVPLGHRVLPRSTVLTLRWVSALVLLASSQGRYLHRHEGVGAGWSSRTREVVVANGIPLPPAPTLVDRARARGLLGLPEDVFVVGIVARLGRDKGHRTVLDAFALLLEPEPTARLVLVGDGDQREALQQHAAELGIGEQVLFTGTRRDVPQVMPAFDVACLASRHEAAPITLIESMAAGVPAVATRVGAIPDMVADDVEGLLVPVGEPAELGAALVRLATQPGTRLAMGRAARARAERDFTIEGTARGYERLLVELVAAARPR